MSCGEQDQLFYLLGIRKPECTFMIEINAKKNVRIELSVLLKSELTFFTKF